MTQQPSVSLDTIQIRYRIPYLTWLRMKAFARGINRGPSEACHFLLRDALDMHKVPNDPAVLLGLEEKANTSEKEE